jgi:3-phosphoshikimate 1-carboxyvinyltransferase
VETNSGTNNQHSLKLREGPYFESDELKVTITPVCQISGTITAPSSKAQTHRALFAGLLSHGLTTIENPLSCDDTEATARGISALGARIIRRAAAWNVRGKSLPSPPEGEIQCGESGVTLRFLIPIVSLAGGKTTLRVRGNLLKRPLQPLVSAMGQIGVRLTMDDDSVVSDGEVPEGGSVSIVGDVSSQFISGLLLAGPLMRKGLRLDLTTHLESRGYVSLTMDFMEKHGVHVRTDGDMTFFEVDANQRYVSANHSISGDYSSAAFPLSAAAITNSRILVRGLPRPGHEPDDVVLGLLSQMGATASLTDDGVLLEGKSLKAATIDIHDSPDLGPVAAVLGCYANGDTTICGASRLQFKESDRLASISSELAAMGADVTKTGDGIRIHGPASLRGGVVQSHGDHRVAMALTVAALGADDRVEIQGSECVSKSYPTFFDDMRALGVEVNG